MTSHHILAHWCFPLVGSLDAGPALLHSLGSSPLLQSFYSFDFLTTGEEGLLSLCTQAT